MKIKKIGIVGTGLMGAAFAERIFLNKMEVSVFNRTKEKLKSLSDIGIHSTDSVEELIIANDYIILLLSDALAINDVLLSRQNENICNKTFIQMATISPQESKNIKETIEEHGGKYIEAPVLGSIPEIKAGKLIVMVGGDKELYATIKPILQCVGNSIRYVGEVGSAAALKLSMNQLIAALTSGFALSLAFSQKNNVDLDIFMETVRESALYAKTYDKKLDKYLHRDFAGANFSTRHLLKDINLFIDDAQGLGLDTSALEGIRDITSEAVAQESSVMDYSSIYNVINPCPDEK